MLSPTLLALAALAAGLGALVQGSVGFGFALVAAPLLTLIDPGLVPGPLTVGSAALGIANVLRTRDGSADWQGMRWALVGLLPGTIAAGAMLAVVSEHLVALAVGTLVLAAVAVSLAGFYVRKTPPAMLAVGVAAGFMGTAAAVSGPPIALVYQKDSGPVIRSTLARFFLAGTVLAVAALVPAGRLGMPELWAGLALLPGVAVGYALSRGLHPYLDKGLARPAVLAVAGVSAAAVLLRELI